jgi:serine/threonine protein kinase
MTPDRWQRAKDLFAAAITLDLKAREAFLVRECAGDEELAREVSELVRHHEQPHEWFQRGSVRVGIGAQITAEQDGPLFPEGSHFGKYDIVRLAGKGGMGVVYLAEDTQLRRKVALKVLRPHLAADRQALERFRREARAASALNHPNVPAVYEADEIDGRHYIATEFVQGVTLSDLISRGKIDWREAVRITAQAGHALAAAHNAGIVHRDVKPGNILIRDDGVVKLADFGIAKLFERATESPGGPGSPRPSTTVAGFVIGTPAYMSPEQFSGITIDSRSDIWSLAAVLYEMLAGGPRGPGARMARNSRSLPLRLCQTIDRALETDRELRYPTMDEFVAALEAGSRSHWPAWPGVARSARLVAGILILAAAYYLPSRFRGSAGPAPFRVDRINRITTAGNVVDAASSPDGRSILYVVDDGGRQSIRVRQVAATGDTERIAATGADYSGLTVTPDGQSFYYLVDQHKDIRALYLAPLLAGSPSKVIDDVDSPVAISPDGQTIEFVRGDPKGGEVALFVAARDGSGARKIASRPYARPFGYGGASWSHDAKSVITSAYDRAGRPSIVEVRLADGSERVLSTHEWRWIGRIGSMHHGDRVVFPAAEEASIGVQVYSLSLGDRLVHAVTSDLASYVKVSAAEASIVAVQEDRLSSIWIAPLNNGGAPRRITPAAGRFSHVSWSPDGSLLAQTSSGREEHIWRVFPDGANQQLTTGPYIDWDPTISRDGARLAFISNRGGGWQLWTSDSDGRNLRELTSGRETTSSPTFAPDGSIVYASLAANSHIFKIRPEGGSPAVVIAEPASNPVISPKGDYVACEMDTGSGRETVIVETRTGRVIRKFPEIPLNTWLRWTPDGKGVAYIVTQGGVSNIAIKSIAEAADVMLTHFSEDMIFSFDMSVDGRELAYIRGIAASDVVQFESAQ